MKPHRFNLLSEYELGRLSGLLEWVSRGQKPIAECCARRLETAQVPRLKLEIDFAIKLTKEAQIKGYVIPVSGEGWYAYGVYRYEWALRARKFLKAQSGLSWLQGLIFGYNPAAIDAFKTAESYAPKPKSLPSGNYGKAEASCFCSGRSRNRNKLPGRFQILE